MVLNLTKLANYKPLTRSKKGIAKLVLVSEQLNIPYNELMRGFIMFLAELVKTKIQHSVQTQTIAGKPMRLIYPKLSPKYNASKPKSSQGKFWINSGFLIENLRIWQVKNGNVFIGYRGNAVHKGKPYMQGHKRVKASEVMLYVERGTRKMPPRPLFTVIVKVIAKNISFYLDMYLKSIVEVK